MLRSIDEKKKDDEEIVLQTAFALHKLLLCEAAREELRATRREIHLASVALEETEKEAAAALVKELTGLLSDAKVQSFVKKLTTLSGTSEGAPAPSGLLGGTFRPRVPTDIRTGLGWLDA